MFTEAPGRLKGNSLYTSKNYIGGDCMSGAIEGSQRLYNANEVATLLNVKSSTVRKYAQVLEKAGYKFLKNEHGYRGYYDKDVIAMRQLMDYSKNPAMTLEDSAKAVVSTDNGVDISRVDTEDKVIQEPVQSYDELLQEFKEYKAQQMDFNQKQMEFNQKLIEKIDQRDKYIAESLERRDRELLGSIRLIQEQKQLEHEAAQKQLAASQEKKSFWSRLFGK